MVFEFTTSRSKKNRRKSCEEISLFDISNCSASTVDHPKALLLSSLVQKIPVFICGFEIPVILPYTSQLNLKYLNSVKLNIKNEYFSKKKKKKPTTTHAFDFHCTRTEPGTTMHYFTRRRVIPLLLPVSFVQVQKKAFINCTYLLPNHYNHTVPAGLHDGLCFSTGWPRFSLARSQRERQRTFPCRSTALNYQTNTLNSALMTCCLQPETCNTEFCANAVSH